VLIAIYFSIFLLKQRVLGIVFTNITSAAVRWFLNILLTLWWLLCSRPTIGSMKQCCDASVCPSVCLSHLVGDSRVCVRPTAIGAALPIVLQRDTWLYEHLYSPENWQNIKSNTTMHTV